MVNILTVDVEDYFHPTEVQESLGGSAWDALPSRVEQATAVILDLLGGAGVRATFFILGWVARRHPALVRRIADSGHEIACHSFSHQLVWCLSPRQFHQDTSEAADAIAQACGVPPRAYRAPSFSITRQTLWALEILVEIGFHTDSSIYPVRHDRYGIPGRPCFPHRILTPSGPILEIPPAAVPLSRRHAAPAGGGAYLRLLPLSYLVSAIRLLNGVHQAPACIYVHPWEFDPAQPRLASGAISRLRTYFGLRTMPGRFSRLLRLFQFAPMAQVCPPGAEYPALGIEPSMAPGPD